MLLLNIFLIQKGDSSVVRTQLRVTQIPPYLNGSVQFSAALPCVSLAYHAANAVPHPCALSCNSAGKFNAYCLITFLSTGKEE